MFTPAQTAAMPQGTTTYTMQAYDKSGKQVENATATISLTVVPPSSDGNMDNAFRVLFETSGGNTLRPATGLSYGDIVSTPVVPVKEGFTFCGWYTDETCNTLWDFSSGIPGDITLYARWIVNDGSHTPVVEVPDAERTTAPQMTWASAESASSPEEPSVTLMTAPESTVQPVLTQATVSFCGVLLGFLAAGILCRRRD